MTCPLVYIISAIVIFTALIILTASNANYGKESRILEHKQDKIVYERKMRASINNIELQIEVADTPEARRLGLSGRKRLPKDIGLFFIFDKPGRHGFWMKGMLFPIDIIWFDSQYQVVHIEKNVSPDTFSNVFEPPEEARSLYVLEVNAGFASENNIQMGDKLTFIRETVE